MAVRPPSPARIGFTMHVLRLIVDIIAYSVFPIFLIWVLFFLDRRGGSGDDDEDKLRPAPA